MHFQNEARRSRNVLSVNALLADLKFCSIRRDRQWGRKTHAKAVETRNIKNIYVLTALINMYAKCACIADARVVFDSIEKPDVVSLNTLLLGYADTGSGLVALEMFSRMKARGCEPDSVTYVSVLKACTSLAANGGKGECLERGREIHLQIGCHLNQYVKNSLIDMYAKGGSMLDARDVFDSIQKPDVVSWNTLLLGYTDNGEGLVALEMLSKMKVCGCRPDSITYTAALKACTSLINGDGTGKGDCLERVRQLHSNIGCYLDHQVKNTLIDMYAKCENMRSAREVFDSIQKPDVVSWNALILGYAENRDGLGALEMFSRMKMRSCKPDSVTYTAALKALASLAANADGSGKADCLERGREIHSQIGRHLDHYVGNTLIDMYAKCGSLKDAQEVFNSVQKPNVVSWNALLLGYANNGDGIIVLEMLSRMKLHGCDPNSVTYIAALKACTSLAVNGDKSCKEECLKQGKEIHSQIGCYLDDYVTNTLIDMYAKCGSMSNARSVFDSLQNPGVVSWNALLLGYATSGDGIDALELFSRMKLGGHQPDSVTYVAVLKACTSLAGHRDKLNWLERGRKIHSQIGRHLDHYVQNTLIDMYAKCGSMTDARVVFDSVQKPNVVTWNAFLLGHVENGDGITALEMLSRMKSCGCELNSVTYIAALKACALIGALALGRKFHLEIGDVNAYLVTCLVDFYAKCGSMLEAREVFDLHPTKRDASTWTALLAGYASIGEIDSVFNLFEAMQDEGCRPDAVTLVCMLLCCSHAGLVEKGKKYFEAMRFKYGVTPTVMHYTCMVDIMGRANLLNEATGMIRKMPCNPDAVTWTTLLAACRKWKNVKIGKSAFQCLVDIDKMDASAYLVMAHIYESVGLWKEQERVLDMRMQVGAWKLSKQAAYVIDDMGEMVKFEAGEQDPLEVDHMLLRLSEDARNMCINNITSFLGSIKD